MQTEKQLKAQCVSGKSNTSQHVCEGGGKQSEQIFDTELRFRYLPTIPSHTSFLRHATSAVCLFISWFIDWMKFLFSLSQHLPVGPGTYYSQDNPGNPYSSKSFMRHIWLNKIKCYFHTCRLRLLEVPRATIKDIDTIKNRKFSYILRQNYIISFFIKCQ